MFLPQGILKSFKSLASYIFFPKLARKLYMESNPEYLINILYFDRYEIASIMNEKWKEK